MLTEVTENQIVASILTIGVFMGMWFLPYTNEIFELFSLIANKIQCIQQVAQINA